MVVMLMKVVTVMVIVILMVIVMLMVIVTVLIVLMKLPQLQAALPPSSIMVQTLLLKLQPVIS